MVNILSIATSSSPAKKTFLAAAQLQTYRVRAILDPRRDNLGGYTAPAVPRPSKAFRQMGKTGNSRWNGSTFLGPGTISGLLAKDPTPPPATRPIKSEIWGR